MSTTTTWNGRLLEQLTWHWEHHLWPRFQTITDASYAWEPVPGMWSVRPRGTSLAPIQAGAGTHTIDFDLDEPVPAPLTTISWRLGHIIVDVLGARNASHFGGPPCDHQQWEHAPTADLGLGQLAEQYRAWTEGVRSLGEEGLERPCGPAEGPFADASLAELVVHIHREVIHHGSEVCLMLDLYHHMTTRG